MKNFDAKRIATKGLLVILSLFVILHLFIMLGVVPYRMVWGGRLQNTSEMLFFEATSVIVNLMMLAAVGIHAGIMKVRINRAILKAAFWAMFVLFLLNTMGNLLSDNEMEKLVFTPLTLLLSLFSLCLALSKEVRSVY